MPSYSDLAAIVNTSQGDYPIWVGWNIIDELGERVNSVLDISTAYIITDEGVHRQARARSSRLKPPV
ncbi:hypothetical protein GBAR_LOCUS975 [Geodia barretti]|uniref:Uncharacterized protein n=1 Tax=Geodia barretti TaxID=519541 RepID=A0AA35VZL2_GEOBA|nr:hypothetical protein GBAR_LOCUS975 [Geodia barretti]